MNQWETWVSLGVLVVTYTGSVIGMSLWLANKFRSLEGLIYKELGRVRRLTDVRLEALGLRLQRLELRVFGFTSAPADEAPYKSADQSHDQER